MADDLPLIGLEGAFALCIERRCQLGGIHLARDDGFDSRVDPAAATDSIPEELKDIIIHELPALANAVSGRSMPFMGVVGRHMTFLGAVHLPKTAETNQPTGYHSSNSYHDSLRKHQFGILLL
jgi:hypothetical protein